MSDELVFQEEQANTISNIGIVRGAPKGALAWLVRSNIVKNAKQAEQFMLGVVIVAVLSAIGVYLLWGNGPYHSSASTSQIQSDVVRMQATHFGSPSS